LTEAKKIFDDWKPSKSFRMFPVMTAAKGLATGNVALAGGTPTLMGELGPELVVSHGRYFIVGQGGAEMVNLAEDAIVFNHIQTR